MKEEEEKEELPVSEDEEDACVTDVQHHDLWSEVVRPQLQGWGLHLVVKHLNCSSFSQRVLNIPNITFMRGLRIFFIICLILTLCRVIGSISVLYYRFEFVSPPWIDFNPDPVYVMFAVLTAFAIAILYKGLQITGSTPEEMRNEVPTVSATVQQV